MVRSNPYGISERPVPGAPAPTPRHAGAGPGKGEDGFDPAQVNVNLDVVMATPVLVVPRRERSFEVLVANLGEITVNNQIFQDPAALIAGNLPSDAERVDRSAEFVKFLSYIFSTSAFSLQILNPRLCHEPAQHQPD